VPYRDRTTGVSVRADASWRGTPTRFPCEPGCRGEARGPASRLQRGSDAQRHATTPARCPVQRERAAPPAVAYRSPGRPLHAPPGPERRATAQHGAKQARCRRVMGTVEGCCACARGPNPHFLPDRALLQSPLVRSIRAGSRDVGWRAWSGGA
jgi:hypothetical protein